MSIKGFSALLMVFNLLGISLGYEGISKLQRMGLPPFHGHGLYHIFCAFPPPPQPLVLFWNSLPGRIVFWTGGFLFPVLFVIILFAKKRFSLGLILTFVWTLFSGISGFWIWLHATIG